MGILKALGLTTGQKQTDNSAVSEDLTHINQEMYKKSVELSERNKTLSLLQQIDEIILGDITHLNELAQKVTSLLVTEIDFQLASLFLYDKGSTTLKRMAFSQTKPVDQKEPPILPFFIELTLEQKDNLIVQAYQEITMKFSPTVNGVMLPLSDATPDPSLAPIKEVFVYPLIVRGEAIGVLVIGLKENPEELSEYRKDLLSRLVELIGIAVENAILYEEVQQNNERLKALDRLKDEFVSLASHELRTPMTAIKSYLWMALDNRAGELNEKQHYYVDRAYTSVDRLIKMVNEMLNISRIESGRLKLEMQSIDLIALADDVKEEILPRANELGVTITIEPTENISSVLADPDKVKEVLINLIGNSLKFTAKGGLITVGFGQKDGLVETYVKDTGAGIAPDDLPKLFQKFDLIPSAYMNNQAALGTGLGLYICRSIIELQGGKISAASDGQGKGATFTFSLNVYNEKNLEEFQKNYKVDTDNPVGIIHTEVS